MNTAPSGSSRIVRQLLIGKVIYVHQRRKTLLFPLLICTFEAIDQFLPGGYLNDYGGDAFLETPPRFEEPETLRVKNPATCYMGNAQRSNPEPAGAELRVFSVASARAGWEAGPRDHR